MKTVIPILIALGTLPWLHAQEKPTAASAKPPGKKAPALFTKQYTVPATYFRWMKQAAAPPSADPFSRPDPSHKGKPVTPEEKLASMGIISGEDGASIVFNQRESTVVLRGTKKHHKILTASLEDFKNQSERQLHVITEFIEVEHLDFSDWLLDNRISGDATELRRDVQEWLRDKRGTILETSLITARSGQRAKTESGDEYIYPTEISPPDIPSNLTLSDRAEMPVISAYPSAFETRNLGVTFEVDPVLGADDITIDLNLAPELIHLNGQSEWFGNDVRHESKISMPIFHRMKVTTQITVLDGRYVLAGSCRPMHDEKSKRDDPMVLLFIRADIGHTGQWKVEEVVAE